METVPSFCFGRSTHFSLGDVVLEVAVEGESLQLGLGQDGSDVDHLVQRQRQSLERRRPVLLQRTGNFNVSYSQTLASLNARMMTDEFMIPKNQKEVRRQKQSSRQAEVHNNP